MIRTALFAPWPEQARSYPGAVSIAVLVGFYALANLPVIIATAAHVIATGEALPPPLMMFSLLLAQFVIWGVLTGVWAGVMERRGPASLGLEGRGVPGRLLLGAGLALALIGFTAMAGAGISAITGDSLTAVGAADAPGAAQDEGAQAAGFRPLSAGFLAMLGFIGLVFLIQGAVEELVFRGWLMSALAARWGVRAGVLVSSLIFMIFHVHVFASGLAFGSLALATIGLMGLVFALASLLRGSIWEAAGAHGVFNALAVTLPALALYVTRPDLSGDEVVQSVFSAATGLAGEAAGIPPQVYAQLIVMAAAAAWLYAMLAGRRLNDRGGDPHDHDDGHDGPQRQNAP
ncbi:CPBP family intramembrane glutamic endopeptidase [Alkalicaulis satelles]|nr:CPBP family intramembrane glutamic endopeptidase [Alkalicaulis satelles]